MAVKGLELFGSHFSGHREKYMLIGGSACYLNLDEQGLAFRATKDLDIVHLLAAEQIDPGFADALWKFIRDGGYEIRQRTSGKSVLYRFSKPVKKEYPYMLELFIRQPETLAIHSGSECIPIPAGDVVSSLSAILLDDDY